MPPFERAPQSGKGDNMGDLFSKDSSFEKYSTLPKDVFELLEHEIAPLIVGVTHVDPRTHNQLFLKAISDHAGDKVKKRGVYITLKQLNTYLDEKGITYPKKEVDIRVRPVSIDTEPPHTWSAQDDQRGMFTTPPAQSPGWQYEGPDKPLVPDPERPGQLKYEDGSNN